MKKFLTTITFCQILVLSSSSLATSRCEEVTKELSIEQEIGRIHTSLFTEVPKTELEGLFQAERTKLLNTLGPSRWENVSLHLSNPISRLQRLSEESKISIAGIVKDPHNGEVVAYAGRYLTMALVSFADRPDQYMAVILNRHGEEQMVNLNQSHDVHVLKLKRPDRQALSTTKSTPQVQLARYPLPKPTPAELKEGVIYKAGAYTYAARLIETGGGQAKLTISISPYQQHAVERWAAARDLKSWEDRSWENAAEHKKDWYDRDRNTGTVFDQSAALQKSLTTRQLSFTLSTKEDGLAGWSHLLINALNRETQEFILEVFAYPFLDAYARPLNKVIDTTQVRKIPWFRILTEKPEAESLDEVGLAVITRFLKHPQFRPKIDSDYWQALSLGKSTPHFRLTHKVPPLDQHSLVVVHASSHFDRKQLAKPGIDRVIKHFRANNAPVIYLVDRVDARKWYTQDRAPDHAYFSAGGEHNLTFKKGVNEVTVIGGFFGDGGRESGCLRCAWINLIYNYFEMSPNPSAPLTINFVIPATYFYKINSFSQNTAAKEFNGLYDSVHMAAKDGTDALPYNHFGPILSKTDYRFEFYADGTLMNVHNAEKNPVVRLKFWSQLPKTKR